MTIETARMQRQGVGNRRNCNCSLRLTHHRTRVRFPPPQDFRSADSHCENACLTRRTEVRDTAIVIIPLQLLVTRVGKHTSRLIARIDSKTRNRKLQVHEKAAFCFPR
jgi:hypothetical protein